MCNKKRNKINIFQNMVAKMRSFMDHKLWSNKFIEISDIDRM